MSKTKKYINVFIASPGGLAEERHAFRDEITKFNESLEKNWGIVFEAVGWEDTLGIEGRPQEQINREIRGCDYLIALFWDRWGSPPDNNTSLYTSATEGEYYLAKECSADKNFLMEQVVLMFKGVNPHQMSDPGDELKPVIKFREKIEREKTHFYKTFDATDDFRKLIRKYLGQWLWNEEKGTTEQVEPIPEAGLQVAGELERIPQEDSAQSANWALVDKAWELANDGQLTKAEVEFAKASVGQNQPWPIIEFGNFLSRIGRLDQAKAMYEKAAGLAEDQGDQIAASAAYGNLGCVLETRGDLDGAQEMYNKALEINKKLGREVGMASDYGNLGSVLRTRGDLDGAEDMYRKSLDIDEQLGRKEYMANQYGNLGNVFKARGDLDGAEQMYRKALGLAEQLGATPLIKTIKSLLDSLLEELASKASKKTVAKKKAVKKSAKKPTRRRGAIT